ncbi:MAG: DUF523 and DUF1722 domain-containing protein, partial [Gammaproteobacteria bacterium]|nr:DUF523 and DUF1722 domain-containing protein [Gammaproteobacteria bacterium]
LLGQNVRYDGEHKRDSFITNALTHYFEFVPVCPEVSIGLGVPRPPIQLRGKLEAARVVSVKDPELDVTDKLREYGTQMAKELSDISGYIFKSKSPSCGMERVKLYPSTGNGAPNKKGVGQYADAFMKANPLLPAEEEGRLHDPVLRENFLERVFTYKRWQDLTKKGISAHRLVEFHTHHKYGILAHGNKYYTELGKLVAEAGKKPITQAAEEYIAKLMATLKRRATRKGHTNVLQHLQGYLKDRLDVQDKSELSEVIDSYRLGQVPLIVPITLLKHHFRKNPDPYISKQFYLNPHPPELMLRNLI